MTIRRDELSKIDFSDVSSGKRLAPVHPGNVLLKDFQPAGAIRFGSGCARRGESDCQGGRAAAGLTSDGLGNIAKPNQCLVK